MPHGQFPRQSVPLPAGSGVPAHEAGVLFAPPGERDGHPQLGEEDLLTWRSQVEGEAEGKLRASLSARRFYEERQWIILIIHWSSIWEFLKHY